MGSLSGSITWTQEALESAGLGTARRYFDEDAQQNTGLTVQLASYSREDLTMGGRDQESQVAVLVARADPYDDLELALAVEGVIDTVLDAGTGEYQARRTVAVAWDYHGGLRVATAVFNVVIL